MRNFFKALITFFITNGIIIFVFAVAGATWLKFEFTRWQATGNPGGLIFIAGLIGSMIVGHILAKLTEK